MDYTIHEQIIVGDLVRGTSIHNGGSVGIVVDYEPNHKTEYTVHWLVETGEHGYCSFYERRYDLEKLS